MLSVVETSEENAFSHLLADEESTDMTQTTEADREERFDFSLPPLPADAWVLIIDQLSLRDIASCLQVGKSWHTTLMSDKIWRAVCQTAGIQVPEKIPTSLYDYFRQHAPSVIGPTLNFRGKLNVVQERLPDSVAIAIEKMLLVEGRRMTMHLFNEAYVILNDEIGLVTIELTHPFRIRSIPFVTNETGEPIAQRRSWTDGIHVVIQATFEAKVRMNIFLSLIAHFVAEQTDAYHCLSIASSQVGNQA